jgi:NAD+ diphosphatase
LKFFLYNPFSKTDSHTKPFFFFSKFSPSVTITMSINLQFHAFAGNPLNSIPGNPLSPSAALESLNARILGKDHPSPSPNFKVLPFRNGRPLVSSTAGSGESLPIWHLGWVGLDDLRGIFENSGAQLNGDSLVYLGSSAEDDAVYWTIDVSAKVPELGTNMEMDLRFVELRTLMVATDWENLKAMENLAIAGNVSYLNKDSVD